MRFCEVEASYGNSIPTDHSPIRFPIVDSKPVQGILTRTLYMLLLSVDSTASFSTHSSYNTLPEQLDGSITNPYNEFSRFSLTVFPMYVVAVVCASIRAFHLACLMIINSSYSSFPSYIFYGWFHG